MNFANLLLTRYRDKDRDRDTVFNLIAKIYKTCDIFYVNFNFLFL